MTERIGAVKPPNPAKEARRGYRSILRQREETRRELEEHYARATSCTVNSPRRMPASKFSATMSVRP